MILAPDDLLPASGPERWTRETVGEAWKACRHELKVQLLRPEVLTVAVLVGIPGSGKSHWTREHDQPGLVIFDACWANRGKRRGIARQIRQAGKQAVAVWVRTPLAICRERNEARPPGRRVPDAALARAWVALVVEPPVRDEGWSRVLVQDGEKRADASVPVETQVSRAVDRPVNQAWALVRSRLLPAYAAAKKGGDVPARVKQSIRGIGGAMERGQAGDQRLGEALSKIGTVAEARGRRAWEAEVQRATGEKHQAGAADVQEDWAISTSRSVREIRERVAPGIEASVKEAWEKGWTSSQLEQHWKDHGLPLEGGGTAEGRSAVLARSAHLELDRELVRAHQEASGEDEYEWQLGNSAVHRAEHVARAGKLFRWSDPPSDGPPGTLPGCNCRARPRVSKAGAERLKAGQRVERFEDDQVQVSQGADETLAQVAPELTTARRQQLAAALISASPEDVVGAVSVRSVRGKVFVNADLKGGGSASRSIRKGKDGWFVRNEDFELGKTGYPKGYGTRALARQVESLRELGIDRIETLAAGGKDDPTLNGYYTWPRLGFDGPLPEVSIKELPTSLSKSLGSPALVSELMATPKGREWWRENGRSFDAVFDTRPESRSSRVLDSYLKERGL